MFVEPVTGLTFFTTTEEAYPVVRAAFERHDFVMWVCPVERPETLDLLADVMEAGVPSSDMKAVAFRITGSAHKNNGKHAAGFIFPAERMTTEQFNKIVSFGRCRPGPNSDQSRTFLLLENVEQVAAVIQFCDAAGVRCPGVDLHRIPSPEVN